MFAGGWELVIILVIVILVFGVGRIGRLGGELGSAIREFRTGLRENQKVDGEEGDSAEEKTE